MIGRTRVAGEITARPARARRPDRSRLVAVWLFAVAVMVFAMVVLGGATRLTGSGLSITQWRPISGALPPVSDAAWIADFRLYRATPQFHRVNPDMDLAAFKVIFWWEWAHRLLGRLVGVVFALPLAFFTVTRRLPKSLLGRCLGLLALGGLQGLVGWWMVRSGLEARVSVAPERLAIHLGLALILFVALIWTALDAWNGPLARPRRDGWTAASTALALGAFLQCMLGALVAGNQAGFIDTDWPLMAGHLFPGDYWRGAVWASLVHGPSATQFDHRLGAYLLLAGALAVGFVAWRATTLARTTRLAAGALALAVTAQAGLGVITLLKVDPLPLAMSHQAGAIVVLALATTLAWLARRPSGTGIPASETLAD